MFCLNGGAVSWKSSKQDTVVDSTTEAEYIAASSAAKEAVWIKKFISELGIVPSIVDPIGLYCDNNGAIAQAKEPRSHQRSKHILRRYHLIREIIDRGDVKICKVPTLDNIADPLTKPLAQQKHDGHTRSMGIRVYTTLRPETTMDPRCRVECFIADPTLEAAEKRKRAKRQSKRKKVGEEKSLKLKDCRINSVVISRTYSFLRNRNRRSGSPPTAENAENSAFCFVLAQEQLSVLRKPVNPGC
ncbi:hypothetical protein KIW84_054859 [Lathyrus oleraceus]|uniref:Uncharacterized protein n=1 Tax=Pisum sativum TaxID=3888 RepID=A0A9D4WWS6_PEA|nr:hypothetical protein KIW84_054859 [Pisum sativum]